MRRIAPYLVWIGDARDAREPRRFARHSISAVIDLAIDEPPAQLGRETVYMRCPLLDGSGNARWLLRSAIRSAANAVHERIPTLVACSAGLSRSPSIVAAGISLATGASPTDALRAVIKDGPVDLSPGLWADVLAMLAVLTQIGPANLVSLPDPANDGA